MQIKKKSKRIFSCLLAFLCSVSMMASSIVAASSATATDGVNIRSGPGSSYSVVGVLGKGETATVVDATNSEWIKIKTSSGKEGYCSAEYLKVSGTSSSTQSSSAQAATTTDVLNVRSGPGSSYTVVTILKKGESVTVTDKSNASWYKVKTSSGKEGYCSSQYLSLSTSSSSSGSSQSPSGSSGSQSSSSNATAVTTDVLNLRSGPGSGYAVVTILKKGESVTVLDKSDAYWIKVRTSSGKEGYCSAEYLKMTETSSDSGSQNTGGSTQSYQTGKTTDLLNLRSGPGKNYSVVEILQKGVEVKVLGKDSGTGWLKVQAASGNTGYCDSQYIQVSSNSGSSTTDTSQVPEGVSGTLTLDTRSYTMAPKGIYDFRARLEGQGLNQKDLKVTSSRTGIATVAQVPGTDKYRITAVGEGTCYIIAEIYGVHASIKVTVQNGATPGGSSERSISQIGGTSSSGSGSQTGGSSSSEPAQDTLSLNAESYQFNKLNQTFQLIIYGVPYGTVPSIAVTDTSVVKTNPIGAISSNSYMVEVKSQGYGSSTVAVTVGEETATLSVTVSEEGSEGTGGVTVGGDGVIIGGGSSSGSGSDSDSTGGSSTSTITGAQTTTAVNLRSGPGTSYTKVTTLPAGTYLTVIDASNSAWIQVVTSSGQTGYVSGEYVRLLYNGETGENYTNLSLSNTSGTVPVGKTFYIKANNAGTGSSLKWTSSNSSVATVSNGYIYAVAPGTATITVSDSSGANSATCTVTVTEAEPVKTAYASPNIASVSQTVELVAVTDNTRDSVRFVVDNGKTIDVTSYTEENATESGLAPNYTRVWRAQTTFSTTGSHTISVYSSKNGVMSTTGIKTTSFVVSTQDSTTTSNEERRASDEILSIMCKWEGYRGAVYIDQLAYGSIPTIGYGQTYSPGDVFYNNITKTEAWSLLLNGVNGSYTTEVNKFITNNHLKVNQQQFDAMISFSHNVGAGYWNGTSAFDIRTILLNAVVPPDSIPTGGMAASTTSNATMYSSPDFSSTQITEIMNGASVTVLASSFSSPNDGWYMVQAPDGTQGWIRAGYVRFANNASMVHDLNYTDAHVLGSEWLAWHHAGGKCWAGLVYRRLGEAKIFSYGNYAEADPTNANRKHNTYNYEYPDCAKQFEE